MVFLSLVPEWGAVKVERGERVGVGGCFRSKDGPRRAVSNASFKVCLSKDLPLQTRNRNLSPGVIIMYYYIIFS